MVYLTKAQRKALYTKVYLRTLKVTAAGPQKTYREFRKEVQPGWDCVMVPFAGMWLGIEKDGYTHS